MIKREFQSYVQYSPLSSVWLGGYDVPEFTPPKGFNQILPAWRGENFWDNGTYPVFLRNPISNIWFKVSSSLSEKVGVSVTSRMTFDIFNAYDQTPVNYTNGDYGRTILLKSVEELGKSYHYFVHVIPPFWGGSPKWVGNLLQGKDLILRSGVSLNGGQFLPIASTNIVFKDTSLGEGHLVFSYWNRRGNIADTPLQETFQKIRDSHNTPNYHSNTYVVEGGMMVGSRSYTNEDATFRDQRYIPHTLSGNASTNMLLTIGTPEGVPEYVGEVINNILSCDVVFVNGRRIVRAGVPTVKNVSKFKAFVNFEVEVEIARTIPEVTEANKYVELLNDVEGIN